MLRFTVKCAWKDCYESDIGLSDKHGMPAQSTPLRESKKVPTDLLDFDPKNPRFAEDPLRNPTDGEIIEYLSDKADLSELVQSIAANGYIDIEPMIVMQRAGGRFAVLEGNRRLAVIKLLKNPDLVGNSGIVVPPITKTIRDTLEKVTVYRVKDHEEARDFVGFKHINGPHKWDALAKARFAADWYEAERSKGITLRDIARRLGDRHDTVLRLVNGIFVLDQAEKARIFDIHDRYPERAFAFSHLYTALTRPQYRDYLGLLAEWRTNEPKANPVPKSHLENLRHEMVWLFGSKSDDIRPVIRSQNPHIKWLGAVLQNPTARAVMLARNDLQEAYKLVDTPAARLEAALVNALQNAEVALSQVAFFDGTNYTMVELSGRLVKTATLINTTLVSASKPVVTAEPHGKAEDAD